MRVPLSWLGEFVELPASRTPEEVHADLVSVGFEEEAIHRFEVTGPVVVGEVLELTPEPQSNGKTINWCQVRVAPAGELAADGGADVRGIVCGAHNFGVGDRVVVTLPGSVLPGDFAITPRTTYGHVSDGMIASAKELTLGDDHDGIIVLSRLGLDPEIGEDAKALLGLDQSAVEINVTPDRGYALSIRGVARELAHATGAAFVDPVSRIEPARASGFPVTLADAAPVRGRAGCQVFATRVVRGVDASRPTPPWMAARLLLAGIRTLSLPVDISNYVMLELGNPIHAYDLDRISGGLTVRRAAAGESIVTLDGAERRLDPEDLVIADESGPVGIAGVMGGEGSKTSDATVNVLIEAGNFDPVSVARSARRHKLFSEASRRYERGVDPQLPAAAAQRAVDLLVELGGGTADELGSFAATVAPAQEIALRAGFPAALMGVDYSAEEITGALRAIGCAVTPGDDAFLVTPPSWRSDLTFPAALVEEVARIVGYDRIPAVLPVAPPGRGLSRSQRLRRAAANTLAAAGFVEVQNYPFVGAAAQARFAADPAAPSVRLANPLDGESPLLRRSLLPGLAQAAQRNSSRGMVDLALIEFGSVFFPPAGELGTAEVPALGAHPGAAVLAAMDASLPAQPRHAAVLLAGNRIAKQPGQDARAADWADAVEAAERIAGAVGAELIVRTGSHPAFHPGRTAELFVAVGGERHPVGFAGELLPALVGELHLNGRVSAAELDLDRLIELAPTEPLVAPLSSYPAATQDLTLVLSDAVPAAELLDTVLAGCGPLLESGRLVDDYRGGGVAEGERALTLALRFRAADRTLTAAEASEAKLGGVRAAEAAYGARIRD